MLLPYMDHISKDSTETDLPAPEVIELNIYILLFILAPFKVACVCHHKKINTEVHKTDQI